jgi:ABC-type phosphate transport system substrate-binding protein
MLKKLTLAVSTALISTSAFALLPTDRVDIEMFVSGASAQDKSIAGLFTSLCVTNTLDVYKDLRTDGKRGKSHTAFFCTLDNAKLSPASQASMALTNPNVLFHKRSKGGSAMGVNPVLDEQAIDAMDIKNGNCVQIGTTTDWNCSIGNPGDLISVVSDAGVSDVNPEMFIKNNTPFGSLPVDATKVASNFDVRGAAALVFGIPVTTTLRDALQVAEFGETSPCVTDKYDPAVDNRKAAAESEACMPSLSKQQVASIMAGGMKTWNAFKYVDSNGVSKGLTDIVRTSANATINALEPKFSDGTSFDAIHICRRVNGSGTQAQMNAKFMNYPCTAGADAPDAQGNFQTGPVVVLNSGSGDVTNCLNAFNDGVAIAGQNTFLDKMWAMGIQSTEKNANLKDNFRFIKIDGVAPTLANAVNGTYFDVVEQTFQWRKGAGNQPLVGDKLVIMSEIATKASNPVELANNSKLNPKYNHTWGQSGYLALSTNGFATNIPFTATNPVTPYTHVRGTSLDNCVVPRINPNVQNNQVK